MSPPDPSLSLVPFAEPSAYIGTVPSPFYKETHHQWRKAIREWFDKWFPDDLVSECEESGTPPLHLYAQAGRDGLLLPYGTAGKISEKYWNPNDGRAIFSGIKPSEYTTFHDLILYDEQARRCASSGSGLFVGIQVGLPPVVDFGGERLGREVVVPVLKGEKRICLAITEAEAGSDVKNLATTAHKTPDGKYYIVNGSKKFITNGIYSDFFTTAVRTSGSPGSPSGISVLVIPRHLENGKSNGVTTSKMKMSAGWASGTSRVEFEDAKVPVEYLLGEENKGFRIILNNFNHERMTMVYLAQRASRICIEDALSYAHTRHLSSNRPLISLGIIRQKFSQMSRAVEALQSWIEVITWQLGEMSKREGNEKLGGITALVKSEAGRVLEIVSREAVQVMGGVALTRNSGKGERVERIHREYKYSIIPGGSEEVLLDLAIRQQIKIALGLGAKL